MAACSFLHNNMSPHLGTAVSALALNPNQHKMTPPSDGQRTSCAQTSRSETSLCVVCCEDTDVTQQISEAIDKWDLPNVRSLLLPSNLAPSSANQPSPSECRHTLPASESHAVAQAEYAIFITPSKQPCSRLTVNPLEKVCSARRLSASSEDSRPVTLLKTIHNRHGQSPQAWWIQLPTTEVRAQYTQPIMQEKSVAQALDQIGIFVRNYQVTMTPMAINGQKKKVAAKQMAENKVAAAHLR